MHCPLARPSLVLVAGTSLTNVAAPDSYLLISLLLLGLALWIALRRYMIDLAGDWKAQVTAPPTQPSGTGMGYYHGLG